MMNTYKGWDVHSYTSDIRGVLPGLLEEIGRVVDYPWSCKNEFPDRRFIGCCVYAERLLAHCQKYHLYPRGAEVNQCIAKFRTYWSSTDGGWKDADLNDVNVAWLFTCAAALSCTADKEDELDELFLDTLADIGGTCIQGDSHRLLCFLAAVLGDKKENKNRFD